MTCSCGRRVRWMDVWACQGCGGLCCPECAYRPEATIYCQACANRAFDAFVRPSLRPAELPWELLLEGIR